MSASAADAVSSDAGTPMSPAPREHHHASHDIDIARANQTVSFNGSGSKRFQLRRMENSDDVIFTTVVRALFSEYMNGLGIDMAFQDVTKELAELPGQKYTAAGNGALFVLEDTQPSDASVASANAELAAAGVSSSAAPPVLVGCIAVKDLGDQTAEAKRLFCRPCVRGLDLGRLLLVHIIDIAAQAGYDRIYLDTLARFTQANALYALLGFQKIPPYNFNPQDDVLYFELAGLPKREFRKGREEVYAPTPRRSAARA
jgi:putative acetyltransferase